MNGIQKCNLIFLTVLTSGLTCLGLDQSIQLFILLVYMVTSPSTFSLNSQIETVPLEKPLLNLQYPVYFENRKIEQGRKAI